MTTISFNQPDCQKIRRLFYDVSYSSRQPGKSGVHRVVDELWRGLAAGHKGHVDSLLRVRARKLRFTHLNSLGSRPAPLVGRTETDVSNWRFKLRSFLQPRFAAFQPGDTLLLPDAYWAFRKIWPAVRRARRHGVRVATVFYDLIPYRYPTTYEPTAVENFRRYIKAVLRHTDTVVTISSTVADELRAALPDFLTPGVTPPRIVEWRLGCDFGEGAGMIRNWVRDEFQDRQPDSPYLVVGSFDSRKNQRLILDAFDQLWRENQIGQPRLAFIGAQTEHSQDLLHSIKAHPHFGSSLFLESDCNDAELGHMYRHARGVITASKAEGFCLPIVEALRHQQRVFASDLPIHREVGGDACSFFPGDEINSLAAAIKRWEQTCGDGPAPRLPVRKLRDWTTAANELLELIESSCPDHHLELAS